VASREVNTIASANTAKRFTRLSPCLMLLYLLTLAHHNLVPTVTNYYVFGSYCSGMGISDN
jgi:hypothetical protein